MVVSYSMRSSFLSYCDLNRFQINDDFKAAMYSATQAYTAVR